MLQTELRFMKCQMIQGVFITGRFSAVFYLLTDSIPVTQTPRYPTSIDGGMEKHLVQIMSLLNSLLKTIHSFMKAHFTRPSSNHHSYTEHKLCKLLKLKIPLNFCYLNTNLCPSRLPLWHRHSHSAFYVSSPYSPVHLIYPGLTQTSSYVASPFPQCGIHITEAAADAEDLFFFHLCCHVKPRFIHLLNPNVIFTMLVCESWGNEA